MAIAPSPGAVAMAAMVSGVSRMIRDYTPGARGRKCMRGDGMRSEQAPDQTL
jgi:hypothetical protein